MKEIVSYTGETIVDIPVDEAIVIGSTSSNNHANLHNLDLENQHPVKAIAGLENRLSALEALQVGREENSNTVKIIYTKGENFANRYKFITSEDKRPRIGRFVSFNEKTEEVDICVGPDIFGVTVDDAGFISNYSIDQMDNEYVAVVVAGVVDVLCETDIEKGDCVISNEYGVATKATENCGYRVINTAYKNELKYATIMLTVQADKIDRLGRIIKLLSARLDAAEANILTAINLASLACAKVGIPTDLLDELNKSVEESDRVANEALDKANDADKNSSDALDAAQDALDKANNAIDSASQMKNEAVNKANQALAESSQLRNEFSNTADQLTNDLEQAVKDLQVAKDDIESIRDEMQGTTGGTSEDFRQLREELTPLTTWEKDGAEGIAGFVAKADETGATLANIVSWKDGTGTDSLAGFVSRATSENAEVKALADYTYTDINGVEHSSVAALVARADDNKASIDLIANFDGDVAGLQAKVNEASASVTTLASHVIGDYVTMNTWDESKATQGTIYYAKDTQLYWYYDGGWKNTDKAYEAGLDGTLAGIQQTADDNAASIKMITSFEGEFGESIAGFVSEATKDSAEIAALASYGYVDEYGVKHYGAAGIMAEVEKNRATIETIAGLDGDIAGLIGQVNDNTSKVDIVTKKVAKKYTVVKEESDVNTSKTDVVYYVEETKEYHYYDETEWKKTDDAAMAGLPVSVGGIQVKTDDNSASINSLASWQGDAKSTMARIEQKADANGAYIQSTVASLDKYTVGPHSQAYGFTREQAHSILELGMIYVPTEDGITETYTGKDGLQTYTRVFNRGYLYKWGSVSDGYGWITVDKNHTQTSDTNTSAEAVYFTTSEPSVGGNFGYWYTDGSSVSGSYEPYTLYKWSPYTTKDEEGNNKTENCWVPVATLAGNSQNRAVSQIRQDTNEITAAIVDTYGSVAEFAVKLSETESAVNSLTSFQDKLTTIEQKSNKNESSITQVAANLGGYEKWNGSDTRDTNKVYYYETERKYYYYKDGSWIDTESPVEAGVVISAASIVTAVNSSDSSVAISADKIMINGETTFTTTDENGVTKINGGHIDGSSLRVAYADVTGHLEATTGEIGGFKIGGEQLYTRNKSSFEKPTDQQQNLGVYVGTDGISVGGALMSKPDLTTYHAGVSLEASTGKLIANNAEITGSITATSGKIGGFTLEDEKLYATNKTTLDAKTGGVHISPDGISVGHQMTLISGTQYWYPGVILEASTGKLIANNAEIEGRVTANSGTIGGWKIDSGDLCSNSNDAQNRPNIYLSPDGRQMIISDLSSDAKNWIMRVGDHLGITDEGNIYSNTAIYVSSGNTGYRNLVMNRGIEIAGSDRTMGSGVCYVTNAGHYIINMSDLSTFSIPNNLVFGAFKGAAVPGDVVASNFIGMAISTNGDIDIHPKSGAQISIGNTNDANNILRGTWKLNGSENITSDRNLKHDIESLDDKYSTLFDDLKPVRFKYNDGMSNRYHTGFIAQDVCDSVVKAELTTNDFAAYVESTNADNGIIERGLRYDEFISLNTWQIQKLKKRVEELEEKLNQLENKTN